MYHRHQELGAAVAAAAEDDVEVVALATLDSSESHVAKPAATGRQDASRSQLVLGQSSAAMGAWAAGKLLSTYVLADCGTHRDPIPPPPRLPLYGRCSAAPTQAGPGGPPAGTASASPSGTHPTALFSAVRTAARRHLAASLRITPHLNDTLGATLGQLVDAVSARGGSESAGCQWAVFVPYNL